MTDMFLEPSVVILGGPNDDSIKFEPPVNLDTDCGLFSMLPKSLDSLAGLLSGKGKLPALPNVLGSTMATISTQPTTAPAVPEPAMMGGHSQGM